MFQKLSKYLGVSFVLIFFSSLLLLSSAAAKNINFADQLHPKRCTTIIVGKDVTLDGSVILAHNEELGDYSAQHYFVQPQQENDPDETLKSYYRAEIPQVAKNYRYIGTKVFDVNYIPGGVTGGINEHQVAIANNLAWQRDDVTPWPTEGRIMWTEYMKFALERASSSRQAVEIIGNLAQTYKHWGPGAMFGITDPNEGWWVEIAQEGQWVAQRVPDNEAQMRANTFRIGAVDFDSDNFMYSDDLVNYAEEQGWYDSGDGPFNFTETYGDPEKVGSTYNTRRHGRVAELLGKYMPTVKPSDLMAILRDHYEGTEYDLTTSEKPSPHHTDERTCCRMETEYSVVMQSRDWLPANIGAVCWRSMTTPCTGVYVPWYLGNTEVPLVYQQGKNSFTPDSAYWAFRSLSKAVDTDYGDTIAEVRKSWSSFEEKELKFQDTVEQIALGLSEKNPDMANAFLTEYTMMQAQKVYRLAEQLSLEVEQP
jgi:dipeptidase